ncbi:hypothetical protein RhiirC2_704395 [Rhizophagus irregularis]|uniref:Uncharacterized protein n=1 Tax=Rhizophagus irregularis TaxID=588596 RepID=A0A2N1P2D5_9GLOM|nr:hypothetical protein RhiirC2_704395 [Rhizophagus irregularis]
MSMTVDVENVEGAAVTASSATGRKDLTSLSINLQWGHKDSSRVSTHDKGPIERVIRVGKNLECANIQDNTGAATFAAINAMNNGAIGGVAANQFVGRALAVYIVLQQDIVEKKRVKLANLHEYIAIFK